MFRSSSLLRAAVVVVVTGLAMASTPDTASALPIKYEISFTASGTIGGIPFRNQPILISALNDTTAVKFDDRPNGYPTQLTTDKMEAVVSIGSGKNITEATITESVILYADQAPGSGYYYYLTDGADSIYLSQALPLAFDLDNTTEALIGYDAFQYYPITTSLGSLSFAAFGAPGAPSISTVSSTVIPEPASLALLTLSGAALLRRRRAMK